MSEDSPESTTTVVSCPNCGEELEVALAQTAQEARCPACEEMFVVPAADGSTELPLEYESNQEPPPDLDGVKMRAIVAARRAAIRSRTYMLLGAMFCAVACAKLITLIVPRLRQHGWSRLVIGYSILVPLTVIGALYFLRRASELNRESTKPLLQDPATPPDFSSLSDGSQLSRNLENLRQ